MIKIGRQTITRIDHHENEVLTPSDLPRFLGDTLELEEGVTFKRIFDLIIINRKIFDTVFGSIKGFYPVDVYLDEYLKEDDSDKDSNEIDYLEVYNVYDYWDYKGEVTIEPYSAFHGICKNYTDEYQIEPCEMNIGVGFTPINQLKKYEIKVNNKFIISNYDTKEKPPKLITFVEGKTSIKLFNFIEAILHEISWHGSPKERQERVDELDETVERIKSGKEEMFEWIIDDETGKHFLKDKDGNLKPFFNDEDTKKD